MKKVIVFAAAVFLSMSGIADDHKGGSKGDLFSEADLDGDGRVSTDEHEVMIQEMADRGRARFNSMDADGDGFVTREEAKASRREKMKQRKLERQKARHFLED